MRRPSLIGCACALALAAAPHALAAGGGSWAAPEIRVVTQAGVLGTSPATFNPTRPLTQGALAQAISTTNGIQHPPLPPPPTPAPIEITSTIADQATIGGLVQWEVDAPGRTVDHVDFAIDGVGRLTQYTAPYEFGAGLDTTTLANGPHQLAVNIHFAGGGYAVSVWTVTVDNTSGTSFGAQGAVDVPVVKSWLPAPPPTPATQPPAGPLYHAAAPGNAVTIKQLDAALVAYLNLGSAARAIQRTLAQAGLRPPPSTGNEAVARLLGLRLNHPANEDYLELLPNQPATRAEAAYSFAHVLHLDRWAVQYVQQAAASFTLPAFTTWQLRILTTAVSYVGYPYVWGGTSPTHEVDFGVPAVGGFDCSGFVWRVYKLTPYAGERGLAGVLRGRTTYEMSGEVPRRERIPMANLQPADLMFFGDRGPRSSPGIVDHMAIYLGNGWFVQSSDEGVTVLPFDGSYRHSFAWGRRPLREAGLE
jgi:cell wall-associated NlpC family hydrolase